MIGNTSNLKYAEYAYDLFENLVTITNSESKSEYTYNPNGLRRSKQVTDIETGVPQLTRIHIWNGTQISAEIDQSGQLCERYVMVKKEYFM